MENRILDGQEKKFRQVAVILANLPQPEPKTGFFSGRKMMIDRTSPGKESAKEDIKNQELEHVNEMKEMMEKFAAAQDSLQKSMDTMRDKIDVLMGGENEANKLIDSIVPTLTSFKTQMKTFDTSLEDLADKQRKGIEELHELVKDVVHESAKNRDVGKEIRTEVKNLTKTTKDLKDKTKEIEKIVDGNTGYLKDLCSRGRKRKNSDSDSRSRSRSRSSRSRSGSRSTKKRDYRRSKKQGGRSSRDTSISSVQTLNRASRENDFEKLLVQINDSIGVLADKLEKSNSDSRVLDSIQQSVVPKLHRIMDALDRQATVLPLPASKWDDADASPSPPRKSGSSTVATLNIPLPPPPKITSSREKRKRKRSHSSSSSSSEDEDKTAAKKFETRVSQLDERLKEMGKAWKRHSIKMEENSKKVMDRMGDMTLGVQVIAENLDNINDVTRKIDNIDELKTIIEKLEGVPSRLKRLDLVKECLERLDRLEQKLGDGAIVNKDVAAKLSDLEKLLDGSSGRKVTTDEYSDVRSLLHHLEEENSKRFCEFGGLVETLQEDIVKSLDRMGSGSSEGGGGEKLVLPRTFLDTVDRLTESVKSVEKNQAKEVLPALASLLALGGVAPSVAAPSQLPPLASGAVTPVAPGPPSGNGSWDHKMAALTIQLSQIQPKLDDLYIKVLPKIEETQSRVRKLEERERLAEQEDRDHIQRILDIVEDLKEERGASSSLERGHIQRILDIVKDLKEERSATSSLDRRIGSLGTDASYVDCELLLTAQGEKLEQVFKALLDIRTSLDINQSASGQPDNQMVLVVEELKSVSGLVTTVLENSQKDSKQLDQLLKNSSSDCKLLSSCNTALQSMKASMNGVNTTVKDVKEVMGTMEEKLEFLSATANNIQSKLQEEIFVLKENSPAAIVETGLAHIQEVLAAIQDRLQQSPTSPPPPGQEAAEPPAAASGQLTGQEVNEQMGRLLEVVESVAAAVGSSAATQHQLLETVEKARIPESLEKLGKNITLLAVKLDKGGGGGGPGGARGSSPAAPVKLEAETISSRAGSSVVVSSGSADQEHQQQLSTALAELGKDLRSQLDDVHDMVANVEESTARVLNEIKADMKAHDKLTGVSINNVAQIMKKTLDLVKQVADTGGPAAEKRLLKAVEEAVVAAAAATDTNQPIMADILLRLDGIREMSDKKNGAEMLASLKKLEASSAKVDLLMNKQEKLGKVVGRVKYLLEKEEGAEKTPTKGRGAANSKSDPGKAELTGGSLASLQKYLHEFKESLNDELCSQSEMLTDISNNLQDLKDKAATREVVRVLGDELRARLVDLTNGLTQVSTCLSDMPDQLATQTAALEENLAASLAVTLRDDNRKNCEQVLEALEELEGKLHAVKKALKRGSGGGGAEGGAAVSGPASAAAAANAPGGAVNLETVLERVVGVAAKLEAVQAAVEATITEAAVGREGGGGSGGGGGDKSSLLSMNLLLGEVRKRADSESLALLSQDMFKAVHNVQTRLLEEHKRLLNKLSESRQTQLDPGTVQLIEALNKVRTAQSEILTKQEGAVSVQTETNRLLEVTVDSLEQTRTLVVDGTADGGQMTARFADLCEELARAVTGLLALQDRLATTDTDSLQRLDSLVQTASSLLRLQQQKTMAGGGGCKRRPAAEDAGRGAVSGSASATSNRRRLHAARNRRADSSSPSTDANSLDMEERESLWEPPEVKQPHVFINKVGLTKEQRLQLEQVKRRNSGAQADDDEDMEQAGERRGPNGGQKK